MRTFDLAPLYRSTVGFDRLFSMLDGFEAAPGYPPYNIERTGENDYRITVAVAGFGESELSIVVQGKHADHQGRKAGQAGQHRRGALSGHRGPRVRAPVPACRLRPGEGRQPRERSPARRSRARDSRGEEAPPDRHRQRQLPSRRWSRRRPRPNRRSLTSTQAVPPQRVERPGKLRGAFILPSRSSAASLRRPGRSAAPALARPAARGAGGALDLGRGLGLRQRRLLGRSRGGALHRLGLGARAAPRAAGNAPAAAAACRCDRDRP